MWIFIFVVWLFIVENDVEKNIDSLEIKFFNQIIFYILFLSLCKLYFLYVY